MRDELDSYLGIFSMDGSIPTSLGGYGLGAQRPRELSAFGVAQRSPAAWDVETIGPKPSLKAFQAYGAKNRATERYTQEWTPYLVKEIVADMMAVGAYAAGSTQNRWDSKLKTAWLAYAQKTGLYPEAEAASRGTFSGDFVWMNKLARAALSKNATAAYQYGTVVPSAAKTVSKPAGSGNKAVSPSGYTTSTEAVQDVLIRLGWKGKGTTKGAISKDLTDGKYGATVVDLWTQSAQKRGLAPAISKASADGTQVSVVENTFLMLKAAADALVPPQAGQTPPATAPTSASTTIPQKRFVDVLIRLSNSPVDAAPTWAQQVQTYQSLAKQGGYDTRVEQDAKGDVVVDQKAWAEMLVVYDQKAPVPAAVKPQERSAVETAMESVDKIADTRIEAPVLRDFFNVAIKQGLIKREAFTSDKWSADYAPLLITMLKVDGPLKQAWEQMLVPGKLVNKNLKFLRLPGVQVNSIKKTVDTFNAAQKADTATYTGYTKVNTAQTIEAINKTGVSAKKFNASGGYKELADAAKTLLENAKVSVAGDLVKVDAAKNVFLKNEVLGAILAVGLESGKRQAATESYRKNIVDEALKASSASVTIDQVQQAFMETVSAGKAGKNKALFAAVKRTGAFDNATRAAYTELARTLTIGPAIQQFQKLLQEQLGPNFKTALVKQVRNDVWNEFLTKAVFYGRGVVAQAEIKIMPLIASGVVKASDAYASRVSVKTDERTKIEELKKALATAVKQSNSIISILDVQQGLLQMLAQKEIANITTWEGRPSGAVKITGVADAATRDGLFFFADKMIFPKGFRIPETLWRQYTDAVGISVTSATKVGAGWNGANYVALPQAVASLLIERAGGWIAKHGVSVLAQKLAPVPLQNQELQLRFDKPSVVTIKAPKIIGGGGGNPASINCAKLGGRTEIKKDSAGNQYGVCVFPDGRSCEEWALFRDPASCAPSGEAAKKARQLAAYRRKKAKEAARKAAEAQAAAAANPTDQKAQQEAQKATTEAAVAEKSAQQSETSAEVATQAAGGQAAGGQAAGGSVGPISINIPGGGSFTTPGEPAPAPAPTPAPAEPEPVAPIQAGMGSSWLLMSAFGLGALFFLKNDKKNPQRPAVGRR